MRERIIKWLPLLLAAGAYLLTGWMLLPYYRYQINPDCFSYFNAARLILEGRFIQSVNDHWNPLIAWFLAPLLSLGMEDLLAAKVMNLLVGVAGFFLMNIWLDRLQISGWMRWLALFVLVPVLLWMAFAVTSPDLQIALALLLYLTILFQPDYFTRPANAVGLGLAAGLAYLAKYYALPFISVHLFIFYAVEFFRQHGAGRRRIVLHYVIVMAIFLTVFFSWMFLQSQKYEQVSMGHHYSGYLFAILNPAHPEAPVERLGLQAPPHPGATSIWDEPHFVRVEPWAPWHSTANLIVYLNTVRRFFSTLLGLLAEFSPFAMSLLLLYLYFGLSRRASALSPREAWQWLLPFLIYTAGYLLLWVEERYLWLLQLWLFIMALKLAPLYMDQLRKSLAGKIVIVFLMCSFCYFPLEKLAHYIDRDKNHFELAARIGAFAGEKEKKIASNKNWQESLYLSHYRQWRYYGSCAVYRGPEEILAALKEQQIDYFLYWGQRPEGHYKFLSGYPELTQGRTAGVLVFDLSALKDNWRMGS